MDIIVKFTGLHASPFGKGFVGFILAAVTLYLTQFFVAGYSISCSINIVYTDEVIARYSNGYYNDMEGCIKIYVP